MVEPTAAEIEAYRAGRLDLTRFELVDRWLAAQSPEVQARLLGEPERGVDFASHAPTLEPVSAQPPAHFSPEPAGPRRYRCVESIGAGGMGIVEVAHDAILGRDVALKRCRPRRPDETLAAYAARLRAFRREAAITAQLEHPGIVPVHDVGAGALGEPAFIMKRLDGEPLSALIARQRGGREDLDLARIAEIVLRVAEAIGYAHRRGIVHRDLKPDNVIIGALGAVSVIDWGLATQIPPGSSSARLTPIADRELANEDLSGDREPALLNHTTGTYRLGTPGWMAPEQFGASPANPRMDVFALGGLLMALLTGYGPRETAAPGITLGAAVNLAPFERRALPKGLVAVARRCLSADPAQRYKDGSSVADELRRWQSAGLTQAEKPSLVARFSARMRHSPRLLAWLIGMAVVVIGTASVMAVQRAHARFQALSAIDDINRTIEIGNENDVHTARIQAEFLLRNHPGLEQARELLTRLHAAEDVFAAKRVQKQHLDLLHALREKYIQKGPWPSEADELMKALGDAGYLTKPANVLAADVNVEAKWLRTDPLLKDVLAGLVQLERAYLIYDTQTPMRSVIPRLITAAGPTPGWRALGEVLAQTSVDEHDLILTHGPASEIALAESETADLLLATYGPEPRLLKVARERWHEDANAFWPRVMSARDCVANGEWREAERHALVALGREPDSLWPHLILAYVALADDDDHDLLREAETGLLQNPQHLELIVLRAVALARSGKVIAAQELIDQCGEAGHLQYHLRHHSEHPMERSVEALVAAGVRIPDATTEPTPLGRPKKP